MNSYAIFYVFLNSIFKFFCIYYFKIHNWHSLFIHVKRYYTFLKLKPESWSQLNFTGFETSLYMRTLYWSMLHLFAVFLVHNWLHNPLTFKISLSNSLYCLPYNLCDVRLENLELDQPIIPSLIFFFILITHLLDIIQTVQIV